MDLLPANMGLYTGVGLCAAAGLRCATAMARWLGEKRQQRREFLASLREFEDQLDQLQARSPQTTDRAWKGYRRFVVERIIREANDICSIYLAPEDCRPLPAFLSGQFLTLQVSLPGVSRPLVRCYSLSERPRADYYRLTVKASREQRNQPSLSCYLNDSLKAGDILESQAPRGDFTLLDDTRPAVLIAAGIGITPLLSMASQLLHQPGERKVILFYGVRNSRDHAFRNRLQELAERHPRLHYIPCYSQPSPADELERNFVVRGRVETDLIRRMLPDADFPFYLCGPGNFMENMVAKLRDWGVAEQDLHFEAFGPATVKRSAAATAVDSHTNVATASISFQQSGLTAAWNGQSNSLLELGEAEGVNLPTGCRSGNCGLCATRLLAGKVRYDQPPTAPLDPGFCLPCVARPDAEQITLDA